VGRFVLEKSKCYVHINCSGVGSFCVVHKNELGQEASDPRPHICVSLSM
jgi:hypothetical protein